MSTFCGLREEYVRSKPGHTCTVLHMYVCVCVFAGWHIVTCRRARSSRVQGLVEDVSHAPANQSLVYIILHTRIPYIHR